MLDLCLCQTSLSGYTCDYVDADTGMYETVRAALEQAFGGPWRPLGDLADVQVAIAS